MSLLIFTFVLAFLVCVLVTPRVREHARRRGILDLPDRERKLHAKETPLGGGFAVFLAVLTTVGAVLLGLMFFAPELSVAPTALVPLLFASLLILAVGLADDVLGIRVRQKLVGQLIAAGILTAFGMQFDKLGLFGTEVELGLLAVPLTLAWLLFTMNSLNLLDGADGFATTIGVVICATLAGMASYQGNLFGVIVASAMAGALAGFLIFNFPPSSIFLGDSGSMLIGLVVGTLALQGNLKSAATFALATPVALLAIPLFDSLAAIVRRSLTGRALIVGDRAHIHHAMMRRGFGPRRLVVGAAMLSLIPAAGAMLSVRLQNELFAWGSLLALGVLLVGGRVFGLNELQLMTSKTVVFFESLIYRTTGLNSLEKRVGLLDSKHCDELWHRLTQFADEHSLSKVRFDLKGSWMDDGRDVLWEHFSSKNSGDNWQVTVPVYAMGRLFGKVHFAGCVQGNSGHHLLSPLGEMLATLGPIVERLVEDAASQGVALQEGIVERILFINRSYWPDVEATGQLLTELCEDLAEDFAVSVLAGQPNHVTDASLQYHRSGVQRRNGVDIYRVRHTKFSKASMFGRALNLVSFTLAATWQSFFIPRHEIVVVESDPFLLAILGGWINRWRGSKFVMYVQDVYPDVAIEIGKIDANSWLTKTVRRLLSKAYARADRVVVLSEDMKARLVGNGVDSAKIEVIPNWADCHRIYPVKRHNAFRAEHNLEDKFVVMHSGNMGMTQQLDQLLEVAENFRDRDDVVFMLVGDGATRPQLEALAKKKQLSNVRFLPYQPRENLATTLSAADLHVVSMHPNIGGCLVPSKIYGIMASGTPVLASVPVDTDLHKFVTAKSLGVSVTPGNVAAMQEVILQAADGQIDLNQFGHNCRDIAETQCDRSNSVQLFSQLLAATSRTGARRQPIVSGVVELPSRFSERQPSTH